MSRSPTKYSFKVAEYLQKHGFHIVPINPYADEILGVESYKNLLDMPAEVQKTVEIVDVFI